MDVRAQVIEGIGALEAGDLERAEALLKSAYEADQEHPDALHFYGLVQHRLGRNQKAEALLRKSIEIDPEIPVRTAIWATRCGCRVATTRHLAATSRR